VIGEAIAIAARLRHAGVPPLELITGDADKLCRELGRLRDHAEELVQEFESRAAGEPNFVDAQAWFLAERLATIRYQITVAHCDLIRHDDVARRKAASNTAEFLRQRIPADHRVARLERFAA
jgi:hypothetical protein